MLFLFPRPWKEMEQIGAAFLPAVGNLTYNDKEWGRNAYGRYWASSPVEDLTMGGAIVFSTDAVSTGSDRRSNGLAVRLVREKRGASPAKATTPATAAKTPSR